MGKKVFVVSYTSTINTKATSDLLVAGEIGVYAMDKANGTTAKATTTTPLDPEFFTVALGRGTGTNGVNHRTPRIDVAPGARQFDWFKSTYAAPVLQQVQAATDCVGASYYDDFLLQVDVKFGQDFSGMERQTKTYSATGKFVSQTALYAKLADAINNDQFADVTATSSSAGVVVIAKYPDQLLSIGFTFVDGQYQPNCMTCLACSSTVTELVPGFAGQGTYRQLKKWLLEARGYKGTIYVNDREIPLPDDEYSGLSTTSTWDFYFLREKNHNQPIGDHGQVFDVFSDFMFAFPAGTNAAAFTQVLDYLLKKPLRTAIA